MWYISTLIYFRKKQTKKNNKLFVFLKKDSTPQNVANSMYKVQYSTTGKIKSSFRY